LIRTQGLVTVDKSLTQLWMVLDMSG
jgi:hypothetical protein